MDSVIRQNHTKGYRLGLFSSPLSARHWHCPKDGEEVVMNQSASCMIYLGDCLGYTPSSAAERARATSVTLNCVDYIAEGRSSFHPVKNSAIYNDQKQEGDKVSKEFTRTRMKNFLFPFILTRSSEATAKVRLLEGKKLPVPTLPSSMSWMQPWCNLTTRSMTLPGIIWMSRSWRNIING